MSYRNRDQGPRGGAEHLARIHGTEEDRVNCPFYFKIGACRHGDKCSRQHHRPPFSETVLVKHMWNNPMCAVVSTGGNLNMIDKSKLQDGFDEFYEEVFEEFQKFGKVEDVQVCENLGDHMVGNVYVKFNDEEDAQSALVGLNGRFYAGRMLTCEFSPVTDFHEARCRQFDEGTCSRGPYCNFMHICEPSNNLREYLEKEFQFKGGRMKGTGGMHNINSGGGGGNRGGGGRGPPPSRDGGYNRGGERREDDRDRGRYGRGDSRDRGGAGGGDRRGGGGDQRGEPRRDRSRDRDREDNRRGGGDDRDRGRYGGGREDSRDRERRRDGGGSGSGSGGGSNMMSNNNSNSQGNGNGGVYGGGYNH